MLTNNQKIKQILKLLSICYMLLYVKYLTACQHQANLLDTNSESQTEIVLEINYGSYSNTILKKLSSKQDLDDSNNPNSLLSVEEIKIAISGPNMEPQNLSFGAGDDLRFRLNESSDGQSLLFQVSLYNEKKQILFLGEKVQKISKNKINQIQLNCLPKFGSIRSIFLLSAFNLGENTMGELLISDDQTEYKSTLKIMDGYGIWEIPYLPGPANYKATATIVNSSSSTVLATASSEFMLEPGRVLSPELSFQFTNPKIAFDITIADIKPIQLTPTMVTFRRTPQKWKEVHFTRLYPAPKAEDSSSKAEWFELMNSSSDTLDLAGMRLTRGDGQTATKKIMFSDSAFLAPGQSKIWGKELSDANYPAGSFSLTNSFGDLKLYTKAGVLLDSLNYSSSQNDSLFAAYLPEGKIGMVCPSGKDKTFAEMALNHWLIYEERIAERRYYLEEMNSCYN